MVSLIFLVLKTLLLQGTYTNIKGFTSDVNVNDDTNYKVIYTYDLNTLSDNDINNLGINRDLNTFKTTLTNRGLTCKQLMLIYNMYG